MQKQTQGNKGKTISQFKTWDTLLILFYWFDRQYVNIESGMTDSIVVSSLKKKQ